MTTPVGDAHYFLRRSFRNLAEGELLTHRALDRATTNHPVVIQAWAPTTPNVMVCNSMALDRLEMTATLPMLQPDAIVPGTERAMRAYNRLGVTTVYEGHAIDFPQIAFYQWLRDENRLSVRVLCCPEAQPHGLPWTEVPDDEQFAARLEQAAAIVDCTDDLLRVDGVTIGRGGPCGPGLILMRNRYRDPYGTATTGRSFVTRERTRLTMRFARERGLRLNIVTAGTGETDDYLDDLEQLAADGAVLAAGDRVWILQHL